jgi:transcription elongation factor Elf1
MSGPTADTLASLQDLLSEAMSDAVQHPGKAAAQETSACVQGAEVKASRKDKPFQCGLCSVTFELNPDLVIHVKKHALTKPFQCAICKVSYNSNPELTSHVRVHNIFIFVPVVEKNGRGTDQKVDCDAKADSPDSSDDESEDGVVSWKRRTRSSGRKQSHPTRKHFHLKEEEDGSEDDFQCHFDLGIVKTEKDTEVEDHQSEKAGDHSRLSQLQSKRQKIGKQSEEYAADSTRRRRTHLLPQQDSVLEPYDSRNRNKPNVDKYTCEHCGKILKSHATLRKHVKNVHEGEVREHICLQCPQRFKTRGTLTEHIKNVHQAAESSQGHPCLQCGKVSRKFLFHMR